MDILSGIFWSVAGELFVAAILAVVVVMWGLWEGTKRWNAAVSGIVVMAALFLVINQTGLWEPPVRIKIHQWLDEASFSVRKLSRDDLEFWFEVTLTAGSGTKEQEDNRFYIHQSKKEANGFVVLGMGFDLLGSFPKIKELSSKELNVLRRQIVKDLMLKGVELKQGENLSVLQFTYLIPVASLTQQEFTRGYYHLWQCQSIAANDVGLALER